MNRRKMKRKGIKISKLSLKFIGVIIIAAVCAIALFALLFFNRYRLFHIFNSQQRINLKTDADVATLQNAINDQHISKNNGKRIRKEMRNYKDYTMYLYDGEMAVEREILISRLENKANLETSSFLLRLYEPNVMTYQLNFYDGHYILYVYSYIGAAFMFRYMFIIGIISILAFVSIVLGYVHRKMRYVLEIGEEMKSIETGFYHSTIIYKGNDEITSLARQLNQLRNVLYDNMVNEEQARKANEELVTAMSHDLRTPLTSLMGYLDILNMKIYKSDEERDGYTLKSKQKAAQMKEMSDKLFNHFLLYAQQDEIVLENINQEGLMEFLTMFCGELYDRHYKVFDSYDNVAFQIRVDKKLLERIFDNLFSNILKYAAKEMVVLALKVHQGHVSVFVKNKKKDYAKEESSHIGLKSISKMMKDMGGNVQVDDDEEYFSIELSFPCRGDKEYKEIP